MSLPYQASLSSREQLYSISPDRLLISPSFHWSDLALIDISLSQQGDRMTPRKPSYAALNISIAHIIPFAIVLVVKVYRT